MLKRDWSEHDDNVIREFGPSVSIQRLAVRMRRQNTAVVARAKLLNVPLKKTARLSYADRVSYGPLGPAKTARTEQ